MLRNCFNKLPRRVHYIFKGILFLSLYILSCNILISLVAQNCYHFTDTEPKILFSCISANSYHFFISLLFISSLVLSLKYRIVIEIYLFFLSFLSIINLFYIWREITRMFFYV